MLPGGKIKFDAYKKGEKWETRNEKRKLVGLYGKREKKERGKSEIIPIIATFATFFLFVFSRLSDKDCGGLFFGKVGTVLIAQTAFFDRFLF